MAEVKNIALVGGNKLQFEFLSGLLKDVQLFGPLKIFWVDSASALAEKHQDVKFKFGFLIERLSGGPLDFDAYKQCFSFLPGVPLIVLVKKFNPDIPRLEAREEGIFESLIYANLTHASLESSMRNLFLLNRTHKNLREKVDQLRKIQKMDMMGPLAAGILHDFNNLLEVIQGNTELLARKTKPESAHSENIDEILIASKEAGKLSKQLSDYSKHIDTTPGILDIQEVVNNMKGLLDRMAGAHIKMEINTGGQPINVSIDRSQFGQILMNLVINARDAQPGKGSINISLLKGKITEKMQKHYPFMKLGSYALVKVKDRGEGVGEEVRDKIFEPFFTTKTSGKGSGLGLSTIYGIVKQYGGYILLESKVGAGSEFQVYLPLTQGAKVRGVGDTQILRREDLVHSNPNPQVQMPAPLKQQTPEPHNKPTPSSKPPSRDKVKKPAKATKPASPEKVKPQKKPPPQPSSVAPSSGSSDDKVILLVEDEESIRSLLKDTLEFEGYEVLEADDGAKGLELSQNHSGRIDLLISDVYMTTMNGPDLAKEIITHRPDMELMYISGFVKDKSIMDEATDKPYTFVQKPFPLDKLTETVADILKG